MKVKTLGKTQIEVILEKEEISISNWHAVLSRQKAHELKLLLEEALQKGDITSFTLEASDILVGAPCPRCNTSGTVNFKEDQEHRDNENELTHWSAHCVECGLTGIIFND